MKKMNSQGFLRATKQPTQSKFVRFLFGCNHKLRGNKTISQQCCQRTRDMDHASYEIT
jgi:hypothetical protein